MPIHDELHLGGCPTVTQDMPALETIQSALYGAIRFAELFLISAGEFRVCPSRIICTSDARNWTLAFGERFFMVEVVGEGFSVRPFRAGHI